MGLRPWLCLLALAFLPSCIAAPKADDWLAVGFRTPEQSFQTFCTAIAGDRPDLEYRCLSKRFREGGQIGFREARDQLLREKPWIRHLARAEITSVDRGSERAVIQARVNAFFTKIELAVHLVRSDYFEVWAGDELLADDYSPFHDHVRISSNQYGEQDLEAWIPLPQSAADSSSGQATDVRIAQAWLIDGFELIEDSPETAN